jgi:NodT family efflux transporter outer membrane factor (OMF) lipoprotein
MMTRTLHAFSVTLALSAAAALSACVVGPNFHRPDAPGGAGYAMSGDQAAPKDVALGVPAAAGPWWTVFGSAALDRTMQQALAGNPTLTAANANLAQARAAVAAARGGLYPQIDANAGVQRERLNFSSFGFSSIASFPGLSNNPEFSLYSVGATASYALPTSGGTKRTIESAAARAEALQHQGAAATLTLTGQVATQAATIAAIRAEIETAEAILVDDRNNLDLARKAEQAGGEATGQRVSAQSQLAADEALLPPLRQNLAVARHALALLVGKAPADWTAPDFDLADLKAPGAIPVSLPSELVRRRPDILAAEAQLHAVTADIGVATAKLYPSLNLTASLTQSALSPDQVFTFPGTAYTLGVGLTQPIFDGGRLRAERKETIAARQAALATYEMTVLRAFGQVADLLQALAHDDEAIAAETRAANSAAAGLKLARAGYSEGGLALLPVIDAERTYNMARRELISAQAQRYLDTIQLFIATGANWTKSA